MVIGGEKLYMPEKWEVFYSELASVDHDWDGAQGLGLPPPAFAMVAKQHMKLYGTTKEQLSMVSVKNRRIRKQYAATYRKPLNSLRP